MILGLAQRKDHPVRVQSLAASRTRFTRAGSERRVLPIGQRIWRCRSPVRMTAEARTVRYGRGMLNRRCRTCRRASLSLFVPRKCGHYCLHSRTGRISAPDRNAPLRSTRLNRAMKARGGTQYQDRAPASAPTEKARTPTRRWPRCAYIRWLGCTRFAWTNRARPRLHEIFAEPSH